MLIIPPLFLNLGSGEIFLIVLVIIMFFGTEKLPEMMRGFARGMREMKNAAGEIQREIENSTTEIQRQVNIKEQIDDVTHAAKKMTTGIESALEDEKPIPPIKVIDTTSAPSSEIQTPEAPPQNPLTPPDIIRRKG
jgi:sec-independent protein translocase protein TatA